MPASACKSPLRGRHAACPPRCSRLLPGQLRYGDYFAQLLRDDDQLPATFGQPLLLRQVVCSKLGCFADGGIAPDSPAGGSSRATTVRTARTLLAVFQRGRQVWSQGATLAALGEEVRPRLRSPLLQRLRQPLLQAPGRPSKLPCRQPAPQAACAGVAARHCAGPEPVAKKFTDSLQKDPCSPCPRLSSPPPRDTHTHDPTPPHHTAPPPLRKTTSSAPARAG